MIIVYPTTLLHMKIFRFFPVLYILAFFFPVFLFGQEPQSRRVAPAYSSSARLHDSIAACRIPLLTLPEKYRNMSLPAVVDNSLNDYWPGMKDQFNFMACQQYCGVAYVFGYEINRARNQPGWYWENSYPTHYTLNFMNKGEWEAGVDFLQSFEIIRQQGQMTSADYGVDTSTSYRGWISGYDKYYRGMFNHLKHVHAIEVNSAAGINTLKNYLNDHLDGSATGGIACYTTSAGAIYSLKLLPQGTPEAGKSVVLVWQPNPDHGLTVIGFNDSVRYDVNGDGRYTNDLDITGDGIVDARDWEFGAFKIANSYGASYWGDDGYAYALYRSYALNYEQGGVWNNRVYVVDADTAYQPLLTLKVRMNHTTRNKIRILAGVSTDTLRQMPDHVIDFPIFNFQGGDHVMQGYDTVPGAATIEFGLDATALLNFIPAGQPARLFLMVEERDPEHSASGNIEQASFISYQGNPVEFPLNDASLPLRDNNTTLVSVVAAIDKPTVQITTASLPPNIAGQPIQVQLEATGGQSPYEWTFVEEYVKKPSETPEPLISGTSILVYHPARSYAAVALPFSFPFYGKRFDSIYVNYFGFISFEPQNLPAPYTTEEISMLRMFPLIVPSFSQQYAYQAIKNDGIWFQADATHAVIRWKVSVSPYVTSSVDDFAVILYPDGRFEFCYGTMDNQGFVHTFYQGVSKGDDLNHDIGTQWDANEISGKSFLFYPPVIPEKITLSQAGLLSVTEADSAVIYGLHVRAADAGKISDDKVLMLSGSLGIQQELICDGEAQLKSGHDARLKLILTNNGSQALNDVALKLRSVDGMVLITDSLHAVPVINPGQSLTIPAVFSFRLRHLLPNGFPVMMTLAAQSGERNWKKDLMFPVVAPEIVVESPVVADGFNERLDPGEIAELRVNVNNLGALSVQNLKLKLVSNNPIVTILSDPAITISQLPVYSSNKFRFQLKASRNALAGSDAGMTILLSDSAGILQSHDFNLRIGTMAVAIVNLASAHGSATAMTQALDSLHVDYDTASDLFFDFKKYASIFLVLGTASTGSHALTPAEGSFLAGYLQQGGNLYMEGYNTWYYLNKTMVHPMFKYTSKKIHAYFYPTLSGVQGTFTSSMAYNYTAPVNYAVFSFEPVAPAYATLINADTAVKNLEIAYDGGTYKTIGSMVDFSAMSGTNPSSSQPVLMQKYLDFFNLNIFGPWPLFHVGQTNVCRGQTATFSDDSFNNITSRSWEFPGGTPAGSNESNPVVRYDNSGKFDVKLTISNGTSTRTILKEQYIHVDQCSGSDEQAGISSLFRIFPNPATDQVTVELNRNISGNCRLMLIDLTGRTMLNLQESVPAGNRISMDLSGFEKGLYFLRLQAGNSVSTIKLMLY